MRVPFMLGSNEPIIKSALTAMGHSSRHAKGLVYDMNALHGQRVDGVYELTLQMRSDGRRSSLQNCLVATADAKNADDSKKYPLYIRTGCLATHILFDEIRKHGEKSKVISIEFLEGKSQYKANARFDTRRGVKQHAIVSREVSEAGDAFNTPQLLKLNGVGPVTPNSAYTRSPSSIPRHRNKSPRQLRIQGR